MIWVISKSLVASKEELDNRRQVIQEITQAKVSSWAEHCCSYVRWPHTPFEFYQCTSRKGEYGVVITAHMNREVQPMLQQILSTKKALVVINSCELQKTAKEECFHIIKSKNSQSEMFLAKQEVADSGYKVNKMENVGTFGFPTTVSERELFQQRRLGLERAIRAVYDRVILK